MMSSSESVLTGSYSIVSTCVKISLGEPNVDQSHLSKASAVVSSCAFCGQGSFNLLCPL